jgi:hypothetical protein
VGEGHGEIWRQEEEEGVKVLSDRWTEEGRIGIQREERVRSHTILMF